MLSSIRVGPSGLKGIAWIRPGVYVRTRPDLERIGGLEGIADGSNGELSELLRVIEWVETKA